MTRTLLAAFLVLASAALAACGFTPVYGTHAGGGNAPVAAALDSVYIDTIPERSGQKLRNLLIDRMVADGRMGGTDSAYRLTVGGIGESIYGIGIAKDATATRSQIKLTTSLVLRDARDPAGPAILTRPISAVASFNQLSSQYTTLVTEDDARDQAIRQLADQVVTQLELYFSNPEAFVPAKAQ